MPKYIIHAEDVPYKWRDTVCMCPKGTYRYPPKEILRDTIYNEATFPEWVRKRIDGSKKYLSGYHAWHLWHDTHSSNYNCYICDKPFPFRLSPCQVCGSYFLDYYTHQKCFYVDQCLDCLAKRGQCDHEKCLAHHEEFKDALEFVPVVQLRPPPALDLDADFSFDF